MTSLSAIWRDGGTAVVVRIERFVLWMFGRTAPWAHVLNGGLAASWALVHVVNPTVLDTGQYGAIDWLPDPFWIAGHITLAALHAAGLLRPGMRRLRALACLGSAWVWLVMGTTFLLRNGLTPGSLLYGQLGLLAATVALYTAWYGRER